MHISLNHLTENLVGMYLFMYWFSKVITRESIGKWKKKFLIHLKVDWIETWKDIYMNSCCYKVFNFCRQHRTLFYWGMWIKNYNFSWTNGACIIRCVKQAQVNLWFLIQPHTTLCMIESMNYRWFTDYLHF